MTSTTKRAKCLSGSHSSTDGGRRYPVARSIVRKLLTSAHPETKKGRINVSILPDAAQCAKSDRLLGAAMSDQEKTALFEEFLAWQKAHRLDPETNR